KGTIKIGATTITYDREAEEENFTDFSTILPENILEMKNQFLGKISQIPPIFSAKKVKGKPLYLYARRNQEVEIKPAEVEVLKFDITEINLPFIDFEIVCSKGTYIRSIANDLGEKLGTGAYLHSLRRTAIGSVSVANALTIQEFQELFVQI
ncbi:MAG: tRNA pseudouridine(55) synthase, partial [Ignavibacteria bacterium]|nr:tRNA pseudouridine(55) synthase [Ignavibacteria bacterium]